MTSAEDVILVKSHWFRKGGEVSEKQWCDVIGILKAQGPNLDFIHLEQMPARFDLAGLLLRARADTGEI